MKFETYIPCEVLRPFVRYFAISEATEEGLYKVLPDTGLVIGFQYRGTLSYFDNDHELRLSASGITGIQDGYRIFKNSADIGTVLIFFKEAGASAFFEHPIHELFRESLSLDTFVLRSKLLILEEQLHGARLDEQRINLVEQFLISRMVSSKPDHLVLAALSLIRERKGDIRIRDLSAYLHTSQSPLEKRFRKIVGTTPKKFASIIRLKHSIQDYKPKTSLTSLAYEAGFFDQAHFIREFKRFTGETPENFFSS